MFLDFMNCKKIPSSVSEEGVCSVRYYEKRGTFLNTMVNLFSPFVNLKYVKIYHFSKKDTYLT